VVGLDVLGEFGGAKSPQAVAELTDRPAPAPDLGAQAAPGQPPAHRGFPGEQREVVHGEAIAAQAADDLLEVVVADESHRDDDRPGVGG
jgi:hypothetical protein